MAEEDRLSRRVRFDAFEADLASGELWRAGARVPIQDLPFRLLAALVTRPGDVVSRSELTMQLWGTDTYVDAAAGLNTAVAKLREALEDDAEQPRFIETVPKRGYRFIAPVTTDAGRLLSASARSEAARAAARLAEAPEPRRVKSASLIAAALAAFAIVGIAAYRLRADPPQVRVAVMLFDNETGRPEFDRLSQGLTDATVFALTANPKLAVIGNAAVLRTARPFRDIALVRDAVRADYIIIGQVQLVDATILVRTHLIRAPDQAHVWVHQSRLTAGEAALQSDVAGQVQTAVGRISAPK